MGRKELMDRGRGSAPLKVWSRSSEGKGRGVRSVGRQREGKMGQKCGTGNLIFMTSGYALMSGTERLGKLCATAEGGKKTAAKRTDRVLRQRGTRSPVFLLLFGSVRL